MTASRESLNPRAGFETLDSEVVAHDLPVVGHLPEWLAGTLLRNGPAAFEAGDREMRHWFDGLAMLHRFTFAGGRVTYANRYLRTKAYRAAREEGRLGFREFATDPCRSIFGRLATLFDKQLTDNAMINVTTLGDRYLAMNESPLSVVFDPDTLAAAGYAGPAPGKLTTAHPHRDPRTGVLVNVAVHLGARSAYRFYLLPETGPASVIASIPVRKPGYVHSFAMSERYIALTEFPLVVEPVHLALGSEPFIESYRWEPERGTRIFVVERDTGRHVGEFETDAGFAFHHAGAFDDGDDLVIDICDHGTPEVVKVLYLDRLRGDAGAETGQVAPLHSKLRRLRIKLPGGPVTSETLTETDLDLPRINEERFYLKPHRYVYGISVSPGNDFHVADLLVKADIHDGEVATWGEEGCYPGEPIFVSAPDAGAEDDGVVLSVVLDAPGERSWLLVLDAANWSELARIEAPHIVPHGFHGSFAAAAPAEL